MLIGGEWVEAASGKTFDVFNPATGEVIAKVAEGDKEDIDRAVAAAKRAFANKAWRGLTPAARARLIWRLGDLIEQNADEFAELETLDNGKPVGLAKMIDVMGAAECFRYYAGWPTKIEGKTVPLSIPGLESHVYTRREPIGVVGQIIPWNFPLMMAVWKLAPALAAGCTCVLKPAEQTPLTALRLGELVEEAGFPAGVVNIVPGYGETAGAALAAHPDVAKIAFTGSTEVGKLIARAATGNLKKVSLELGGKSPTIVLSDADMKQAVPGAANAIFFNSGQVCVAGSRLYVEKNAFDAVVEGVANVAENIRVGPGLDPKTQMGPMVSAEQQDRVCSMIESGLEEGAEVVTGGQRIGNEGYFVQPTIMVNTTPDMRVVREEIFGPVVTAMPVDDLSEIAAIANDTPYGLAASIWTTNLSNAHKLAAQIDAGLVWINAHGLIDNAMPFGGFKQSGWGRELGKEGLEMYTELKTVCAIL